MQPHRAGTSELTTYMYVVVHVRAVSFYCAGICGAPKLLCNIVWPDRTWQYLGAPAALVLNQCRMFSRPVLRSAVNTMCACFSSASAQCTAAASRRIVRGVVFGAACAQFQRIST